MLLFILLISYGLVSKAQWVEPKIDFETPLLYVQSKFSTFEIKMGGHFNNIWQVGHPQKTFFDSAYSDSNVIVTDTTKPYPKNAYSYFDVFVYDVGHLFGAAFGVSFKHKYQTTKHKAGGYILVSPDNKITWDTLIDKNSKLKIGGFYDAKSQFGLYNYTDTLNGGMPAFSGESSGWQDVNFSFGTIILKKQPFDTLIFRFIFQSDSTTDTKDGWMVDDITIGSYGSYGISENNSSLISLFPNPTTGNISIKSEKQILNLIVKDFLGREVLNRKEINQNTIKLQINYLPKGQYSIEVETDKGLSTQRLILQ